MSLELAITENTNAIRELIAAIKAGVPTTPAQVAAVVSEAKTKKKVQAEVAENTASSQPAVPDTSPPVEAAAQEPAPVADPSPAPVAASVTAEPVTYEQAGQAVRDAAKVSRDKAVAVLAKFGATKLSDVKAEHYAEVVRLCKEVTA